VAANDVLRGIAPRPAAAYDLLPSRPMDSRVVSIGLASAGGIALPPVPLPPTAPLVFTLPILAEYKYAWRLDSHVRYLCDIVDDPIARMEASGALYGYALRMKEKMDTIPSLWATAEEYAVGAGRKARVREQWDVTIPGHSLQVGCHYWNNMEITRLEWFSGPTYQAFFKHLDASGGFFYERWGDAPIRSWALMLLADPADIMWFDIGYQHPWWVKCPPASGVCFKKGVALKPGVGEGCVPDPEIQPHTFTDGAMCDIGQ
jgi:hypothetical protein